MDYSNAISRLADVEVPDIFGLSSSTNTSKDLLFCRNLLKQLKSNYFSTSDNGNYEKRLKPFLILWKKLTSGMSIIQSYKSMPSESPKTPWTSFVLSEFHLAGRLFETIHHTLSHLHGMAKDNASFQADDVQLMESICENLVPLKWRQIWTGSRTLIEYMKGVVSRSIEAERRLKTMMHLDFGDEIDFVNVFNIESYLAALKLTNAKELRLSTCNIDLRSTLLGRIEKSNLMSPKVGSIVIDGALFRNNKVVMFDQITTLSPSNVLPDFHINFNVDGAVHEKDDVVELPLYSNSSREHSLCTLKMCSDATKDAITLAGVALIVPENF